MRKTKKLLNEIIQELEETPIVSVVCNKFGLSRNTFYRWKSEDSEFDKHISTALNMGRNHINDMAESQIIKKIQQGDNSMIKFWLNNNNRDYYSRTRVEAVYRPRRIKGW